MDCDHIENSHVCHIYLQLILGRSPRIGAIKCTSKWRDGSSVKSVLCAIVKTIVQITAPT